MAMDEKMFANYAEQLEKEDFEDEVCDQSRSYNYSWLDFAQFELKVLSQVRGLSCSIHQLVDARQETISKLRASADYLDSIWMRCEAMYGDVDLVKDMKKW